jgi:hypothetical protein
VSEGTVPARSRGLCRRVSCGDSDP